MCASVSRTEGKLFPRFFISAVASSFSAASSVLPFAHRLYSYSVKTIL